MAYKLEDNSTVLLSKLRANANAAVETLGPMLVEAVQEQMLYGYHTPHGPDGHTEIVDTGALFDSIDSASERQSENLYVVAVGTNMSYAQYVHEGTYKLESRPFVEDGVLNAQDKIQAVLAETLPNGMA